MPRGGAGCAAHVLQVGVPAGGIPPVPDVEPEGCEMEILVYRYRLRAGQRAVFGFGRNELHSLQRLR